MQATAQKSFIQLLEDEIRNDLRREIEAEVMKRYGPGLGQDTSTDTSAQAPSQAVHAAGRLETWLASNMGRTVFSRAQAGSRSYNVKTANGSAAKATTESAPTQATSRVQTNGTVFRFTATTSEQLVAAQLLARHAQKTLSETFSADELKTVWRKAALQTHPDRFAGEDQITQVRMAAIFRELCDAYELLVTALEDSKLKAA